MKCPCCKQEMVDRTDLVFFDAHRTVVRGEQQVILPPTQYRILKALRNRSMNMDELIEVIYSDRADGGPLTARNSTTVQIVKLNYRIAALSVRVGPKRKGAWAPPYELTYVA